MNRGTLFPRLRLSNVKIIFFLRLGTLLLDWDDLAHHFLKIPKHKILIIYSFLNMLFSFQVGESSV